MAITINGSGTITGITAGGYPDATVTADDLAATLDLSGKTVTLPSGTGGKVLQVVSTTKTDTFTTTATYPSPDAVTGLSVTIQPSSTSNKILVLVNIGVLGNSTNDNASFVFLAKGGTLISGAQGNSSGSRAPCAASVKLSHSFHTAPASFSYLDSPSSTSSLTYQVYCSSETTTTATINRMGTDNDASGFPRAISTITAMEVAG